jgi:CHAT domain-containing protein
VFYRQIRLGASPAEALAIAQRNAIRQSGYSWAAYTLSGTPQVASDPKRVSRAAN